MSQGPPEGRVTRGKTAPGRLARLDRYLVRYERGVLRRQHPSAWANAVFVDLGCGERPWTTVESAARFREVWPGLPVVGVEIHPGRVAAAQAWSDGTRTRFVEGGFELGAVGHRVRLLRAMNVLRQYRPEDVAKAHAQMGARLVEGGLLVEGTCDKHGQTLAAHLMRQRGGVLRRESLLMTTDFSRGFAPLLFRDVLPRDLRRRVVPGEPIHALFEAWTAAWQEVRSGLGPRQAFVRSLQVLACRVPGVATDPWLLTRGYARWSPPGGVPQPYGRVATLG